MMGCQLKHKYRCLALKLLPGSTQIFDKLVLHHIRPTLMAPIDSLSLQSERTLTPAQAVSSFTHSNGRAPGDCTVTCCLSARQHKIHLEIVRPPVVFS